jgi:hypothetical protein
LFVDLFLVLGQMQKDGTYRVVYGTDLDKITGSVKLAVVGYGRKTQEGGDTRGGGSATELSANITKLNQALTVWIKTWWSWLASWGLVFWDSAFSLLICSWFGVSQSWSFWSLWGWVSARCLACPQACP